MKGLEISILKEDKKIYDLKDTDKYEEEFVKEFEASLVGKALIKEGYKYVHRDFDDCTLQLFYRKKK